MAEFPPRSSCPAEMESVKLEALTELEEGKESAEFWRALRASPADRSAYSSRLTALTGQQDGVESAWTTLDKLPYNITVMASPAEDEVSLRMSILLHLMTCQQNE